MKGLYITTYDANNAYSGVCKKSHRRLTFLSIMVFL